MSEATSGKRHRAMKDGFRVIADRLLYSKQGQIISAVLMGFAFALIFRKVCNGAECKVILAPPIAHIKETIYELEGECYKYTPIPSKCPKETFVIPTDMPTI